MRTPQRPRRRASSPPAPCSLAVAGFKVLEQRGLADEARDRLLNILTEANEDAEGFHSTSQYVVVMGRSTRVKATPTVS